MLVVLLAAKGAAEVAERLNVPTVVGEIVAGLLVGPSLLGLVGDGNDVLRVLGELGVILLLLDVGLEMDLTELGAVGRASLGVAVVGVALPLAGGGGAALLVGLTGKQALFVGAALTATSVGITARVFGDLRALATVEARTVLGAAVADDVLGLVILTVVVRVVAEGSVSAATVGGVVAAALAFLGVAGYAAVRGAPPLLDLVARRSRSAGTLVGVALAFALAVAELANAARLAPVVGAFVAGLAMARSDAAPRIRRELTPVGHLFVPVFFLQIGIDADVRQFLHPNVLGLAALLLTVAVAGKVAAAAGMLRAPGDRLLVGIGMVPRGEVGLIFATLGLRTGVLGRDLYAALLLVVLATTLGTPPLLRRRLHAVRARAAAPATPDPRPPGGWLVTSDGTVELAARPPLAEALPVALAAAVAAGTHRPGERLLDWLGTLPETPLGWDPVARQRFFALLRDGGARAWRLLTVTGVLDRALPEVGAALARRQRDANELDPLAALRWPTVARVQPVAATVPHPERLLLAALVLDLADDAPVAVARRLAQRLDLGAAAEQQVARLVADAGLYAAAARRLDALAEEPVLCLAVHLGGTEQAGALLALTRAAHDLEPWEAARLAALHDRVRAVLAHPELTGRDAANLVERRRADAARRVTGDGVRHRVETAPRAHVLHATAEDLARQAALCEPRPAKGAVRVAVSAVPGGRWRVDVAARDELGLLAREAAALAGLGLRVADAVAATWPDGTAVTSFVATGAAPDAAAVERAVAAAPAGPVAARAVAGAAVTFDDEASPWHTLCRVTAPDADGLLAALAAAFAGSGASVRRAVVATVGGEAVDTFELTGRDGGKVDAATKVAVVRALAQGVAPRRRLRRPRSLVPAG
ncbi:MAG TPA: cation:proton antiporter [Mycobacteriales bacterium]|nr:cation:proton antiporter [Mycobacteriales bacterium]